MNKHILRAAIVTGLVLLFPLYGEYFIEGWDWGVGGFIFAGVLVFSTAFSFFKISEKGSMAYKLGVGIGLVTAFLVLWVNAAVQIIGEENPANLLYALVLIIGLFSVIIARLQAKEMSRAMLVIALAQFLVPVIAIFIWTPEFYSWEPGVARVFFLNGVFTLFWVTSGLFFRRAAKKPSL